MFSKDIISEIQKNGSLKRIKSPQEIQNENINEKLSQLISQNIYLEDSIKRVKEQVAQGKEYKFTLNRDKNGFISDIVATPLQREIKTRTEELPTLTSGGLSN